MANNVNIPAVGTGDTTPIVSADQVSADSSKVQNVQLTSVASGVLTRLGTSGSPLEVAIVGTVPISGAPTTVTANLGTLNGAGLDTSLQSILTQLNTNTTNVNVFRINGQTMNLGAGVIGSGTQRVVLATDQAQLTNALKVDASATVQPVSATALPLPSGAATQTTLASLLTKTPAIGTAGTPAADVISVQGVAGGTAIPVSGSFAGTTDMTATGTMNTANATVFITGMNGLGAAIIQISGTFTGWIGNLEVLSPDGTTWASISPWTDPTNLAGLTNNSNISNAGYYAIAISGFSGVRVRQLGTLSTGTVTVNIRATAAAEYVRVVGNISTTMLAGTNIVGKVGIDQTTPGTTNGVAIVGGAVLAAAVQNSVTSSAGTVLTAGAYKSVMMRNLSTSASSAFIGPTGVTLTTGMEIKPGEFLAWGPGECPSNTVQSIATSTATLIVQASS